MYCCWGTSKLRGVFNWVMAWMRKVVISSSQITKVNVNLWPVLDSYFCLTMYITSPQRWCNASPISVRFLSSIFHCYGLFTPHGKGTKAGTENRSGTIGNHGFWSLSLSWTNVNISTWYQTFHLIPVTIPIPFSSIVNIPLLLFLKQLLGNYHISVFMWKIKSVLLRY